MTRVLRNCAGWFRAVIVQRSERRPVAYGLRISRDATLLNPSRPYETSSVQAVQAMREGSGHEPATRTIVLSTPAGNRVQIFLLRGATV